VIELEKRETAESSEDLFRLRGQQKAWGTDCGKVMETGEKIIPRQRSSKTTTGPGPCVAAGQTTFSGSCPFSRSSPEQLSPPRDRAAADKGQESQE